MYTPPHATKCKTYVLVAKKCCTDKSVHSQAQRCTHQRLTKQNDYFNVQEFKHPYMVTPITLPLSTCTILMHIVQDIEDATNQRAALGIQTGNASP